MEEFIILFAIGLLGMVCIGGLAIYYLQDQKNEASDTVH